VLVARRASHRSWKVFDVVSIVLAGSSGPFAIFLAPVAVLAWWRERSGWRLLLSALVMAAATVQALVLLLASPGAEVPRPSLGASVPAFFALWTKQVVHGAFIGQRGLEWLHRSGTSAWAEPAVLVLLGAAALGVMGLAALRGPFALRMILLLAAAVFAAALIFPPPASLSVSHWESISNPSAGNRYFLLPIFALGLSIAWLSSRGPVALRVAGQAALLGLALGAALDWRQPALRDYAFERYVGAYATARPGEKVQIPYPPSWARGLRPRHRNAAAREAGRGPPAGRRPR
jgi:hypothetical protein